MWPFDAFVGFTSAAGIFAGRCAVLRYASSTRFVRGVVAKNFGLEGCKALGLITSTGVVAGGGKLGWRLCVDGQLLLTRAQAGKRPRWDCKGLKAVELCLLLMGFAAPRSVPGVVLGN